MQIIKAIIFDIDGTIYPNEDMFIKNIPLFLKNLKIYLTFSEVRKEMRKNNEIGDFYNKQNQLFAQKMKITPEEAQNIINDVFYKQWKDQVFAKLKIFKDFVPFLEFLKEKNIKVGFLSDFPIANRLDLIGVPRDLYYLAYSTEDIGALKPANLSFEFMAQKFNMQPQEILYVGNSYKFDIVGAKKAGYQAAHITKKIKKGSIADFSFYNYNSLKDILLKNYLI